MRLFRMGLVAALAALCACDGGDDEDGDNLNPDGEVCSGTVSGVGNGKIVFCTLEAQRLSEDNLTYTYKFDIEWESGETSLGAVTLQTKADPQKGTFTASDFDTVFGDVRLDTGVSCYVSAGQNQDRGSFSVTIDSIPQSQKVSSFTIWEWFGGSVQATFEPIDATTECPGALNITAEFVPQT